MARSMLALALTAVVLAPAAAATDYCNCPYGVYSRAYQNCAADCAAHVNEA